MLLVVGNAGDGVDPKVDERVIEEIQENGDANVIVILKDELETGVGIFSAQEEISVSEVVEELNINKEKEFSIINGFSGEISYQDLENLLEDERVEKIEYDYPIKLFLQDSVDLINASVVHSLNYNFGNITGRDQTVCILDTGINYTHPGLGGCFGNNSVDPGCKVIGGHDYVNSTSDAMDDNGHGTHVAGIVASNSTPLGIATDSFLISIKVLNDAGSGYLSDAVLGVEWCANNSTAFNISVISMSLGTDTAYESNCDGSFSSLASAINDAVGRDIVVLAAAGNSGNTTAISSPACITNVTAVGWSDKSDSVYSSSNRNSLVKLFAPGSSINSTSINGGYEEKSGTSMSTPHIAGVVALLKQYYNDTSLYVNSSRITQELEETGKTIFDSTTGLTFYRIDAHDALNDTAKPRVEIGLSNATVEMLQDNLTITINFTDAFLDATFSNISYPNGTLLADFSGVLELNQNNLTEIGIYTVIAWANDTNYNENLTTKTFAVQDVSGIPTVITFNYPEANPNITAASNVLFNVTLESKYTLSNVTLYHNFTDWHANQTLDLSTNDTSIEFNSSFIDGTYFWGIEACDVNNLCNFSENRTLSIDQSDPVVNLFAPSNATTVTVLPIDFTFNVTDYKIDSCTLTLKDSANETLSSVALGSNNVFTEDIYYLSNGNYNWSVNCIDTVNRNTTSDIFDFVLSCSSSFTRDCTSYSACSGGTKTRLCYDANYCTSAAENQSSTSGCSDSSGGSGSGGSGGSGGAGGGATTTVTDQSVLKFQANAGDVKSFGISKDVGISGLELEFKNAVANAEVTVEKQDGLPAGTSAVDNVYGYIKININFVDEDLKEARIKFNVPKNWILTNALNNPTGVYMSRYTDGKWVKLETLTAGTEEENQKYEAITPGFSYFAISADKAAATTTILEAVTETNESKLEEIVIEDKTEDKKKVFSFFTGSVVKVKDLIKSKSGLYLIAGIVSVLLLIFLVYKFRSKLDFFKKINLPKVSFEKFNFFKRIGAKVIEKENSFKRVLKKKHKDKITREKEKLDQEKKKLEEERKEVEGFKKEEEKKKEKEERDKVKREKEIEKQRRKEESERENEKRRKEKEEEEKVKREEKTIEKQEKEERKKLRFIKEKEREEGFEIKHDKENKWRDFELENIDD